MIQNNPVFVAETFAELKVSAYADCDGDIVVTINGKEHIITPTEALELAHVIAHATAPEGTLHTDINHVLKDTPTPAVVLEREPEDILSSLFKDLTERRLGTAGQARQVPSDF